MAWPPCFRISSTTWSAARADVSRRDEVASLVAATVEHYGGVDILVNNAAVLAPAPLAEITDDQVDRQFDVNVKGALYATQAAVPAFRNGGRVVNVSSIVAEAPLPGSAVYAASKAALESITRTFAAELAPRGVTVNGSRRVPRPPTCTIRLPRQSSKSGLSPELPSAGLAVRRTSLM